MSNKFIKFLQDILKDDSKRFSLSKTILLIGAISLTVCMFKMIVLKEMTPEYFLIYASFVMGHSNLSKYLDTKSKKE